MFKLLKESDFNFFVSIPSDPSQISKNSLGFDGHIDPEKSKSKKPEDYQKKYLKKRKSKKIKSIDNFKKYLS